ncbi:MAG: hypothetical protein AB1611_12405 [bacterium]
MSKIIDKKITGILFTVISVLVIPMLLEAAGYHGGRYDDLFAGWNNGRGGGGSYNSYTALMNDYTTVNNTTVVNYEPSLYLTDLDSTYQPLLYQPSVYVTNYDPFCNGPGFGYQWRWGWGHRLADDYSGNAVTVSTWGVSPDYSYSPFNYKATLPYSAIPSSSFNYNSPNGQNYTISQNYNFFVFGDNFTNTLTPGLAWNTSPSSTGY